MKINKANNNNSASIIIPKNALAELGWKIGDECILTVTEDSIIIKLKDNCVFT